jgi:hypothetical protein
MASDLSLWQACRMLDLGKESAVKPRQVGGCTGRVAHMSVGIGRLEIRQEAVIASTATETHSLEPAAKV